MKTTIAVTLACTIFFSGCASNEPSPEMRAWARQEVQRRQQAEIDAKNQAIAQAKEVQRLKEENEKMKAEAEHQKKEAQIKEWLTQNKETVVAELTKQYSSNAQAIMEAYGFKGKVLDYEIDDAGYENGVLYFQQLILWQKPDFSGGGARIITGMDIKSEKYVYDNIEATKDFTYTELKSIMNGGQNEESRAVAAATQTPKQKEQGFYERNKSAVDDAAIGVGAAAASAIMLNLINSWFQNP